MEGQVRLFVFVSAKTSRKWCTMFPKNNFCVYMLCGGGEAHMLSMCNVHASLKAPESLLLPFLYPVLWSSIHLQAEL